MEGPEFKDTRVSHLKIVVPASRAMILPLPELIESEQDAWRRKIPQPPNSLVETLEKAEKAGLPIFEPHFLPKKTFTEKYASFGLFQPPSWFWKKIDQGDIEPGAATLPGIWSLVDRTPRPDYPDNQNTQVWESPEIQVQLPLPYANDYLGPMLKSLREQGKINFFDSDYYKNIPAESRFGISWNDISDQVNPAIAEILGVEKQQVRLPRGIEFLLLGKLFYPGWRERTSQEWFQDAVSSNTHNSKPFDSRLHGGRPSDSWEWEGGNIFLSARNPDVGLGNFGFRPIITFPNARGRRGEKAAA